MPRLIRGAFMHTHIVSVSLQLFLLNRHGLSFVTQLHVDLGNKMNVLPATAAAAKFSV